jgi:hypothetical protein
MIRIQLVPFPRMKPLQPSSRPIFTRAFQTDNLYSPLPALWTWSKIFNRSRGETMVLEIAPATPPATKAATTGSDNLFLAYFRTGDSDRSGDACAMSARRSQSRTIGLQDVYLPTARRRRHLSKLLQRRPRLTLPLIIPHGALAIQAHDGQGERLKKRGTRLSPFEMTATAPSGRVSDDRRQ